MNNSTSQQNPFVSRLIWSSVSQPVTFNNQMHETFESFNFYTQGSGFIWVIYIRDLATKMWNWVSWLAHGDPCGALEISPQLFTCKCCTFNTFFTDIHPHLLQLDLGCHWFGWTLEIFWCFCGCMTSLRFSKPCLLDLFDYLFNVYCKCGLLLKVSQPTSFMCLLFTFWPCTWRGLLTF